MADRWGSRARSIGQMVQVEKGPLRNGPSLLFRFVRSVSAHQPVLLRDLDRRSVLDLHLLVQVYDPQQAAGAVAAGHLFREQLVYWLADGSERIVEFAMHPIRDRSGAVAFLHPTGIDVTGRKQIEAQLRDSELQ